MASPTQPSETKAPTLPDPCLDPDEGLSWTERARKHNLELIQQLPLATPEKKLLEYRWLGEIDWTEREASRSLRRHHALRVIAIVGGVAVSGLVGAGVVLQPSTNAVSLAAFVTSLVVTGAIALDEYFRFGEKHRHLRQVTETLRSEGALYFGLTGSYFGSSYAQAFPVFVERVERVARSDVEEWVTNIIGTPATPSKGEAEGQLSNPPD